MISRLIDRVVSPCRDGVARLLVRMGLRPNHITVLGMWFTVGAGVAIACGRANWRAWSVSLLVAAGACDILDGAMAHVADLRTRFGAVLDSVCDRVSDAALFLGAVFYFTLRPDVDGGPGPAPNLTLATLAGLGLVWAFLTSYLRARALQEGLQAHGGFWQRGERIVTILLGLAFHHLATAVWILALLPTTTVAHRLWRARRTSAVAPQKGATASGEDDPKGLLGILLWRYRRGTVPYDFYAGAIVAMLVFWNLPPVDPLRDLLAKLVGA